MDLVSDFIVLLQQSAFVTMFVVALLGLCIGSFLNVVIYRTPLMMQAQWQDECRYLLQDELAKPYQAEASNNKAMSLSFPPSRCPHCAHQIRWYENEELQAHSNAGKIRLDEEEEVFVRESSHRR